MHGRYYDVIGIIDEPVRLDFDVFSFLRCDWISRKKSGACDWCVTEDLLDPLGVAHCSERCNLLAILELAE